MTELSKEILEKFQIRKTKAQKTAFIELIRAHFPKAKVEEGGFPDNRNIVIGDPDSAKAVFGAHYDTCARMPIPNFIMPKNILISVLYALVLVVPMIVIAGILLKISDNTFLALFVYWMMLYLIIAGPANKHTVNDNTSGVITLIELMNAMTEEERAQSCFVFFDNEEKGLFGSSFFAKKHKETMKEKLLVNFDCVSDGDYLMLIQNKKAAGHSENLKAAFADVEDKTVLIENSKGIHYPSDQKNFKNSIGVAAFNKSKFGLYLDKIHTPKDTVFDERNIDVLIKGFKKFINLF